MTVLRINRVRRFLVLHWDLTAAAIIALLVAGGAFGTIGYMEATDTTTPTQQALLQPREISVDEAIRQCNDAPVTRSERQESSGTVQIWVCPDGREILAFQ